MVERPTTKTRMILDGVSPTMAAQMQADVFGFNRSEMVNGIKAAVSRVVLRP
jgi:hypothetical protein